jgi:hypothetical protein
MTSWNFLLRGAGIYDKSEQYPNPLLNYINDEAWDLVNAFEQAFPEKLEGLCESMKTKKASWENFATAENPLESRIP